MLQEYFTVKPLNKEKIAKIVIENPELTNELFSGLSSSKADVKFGSDKLIRYLCEKNPALLYSHFDFFVNSLNHQNNILKWGAILAIASLTKVDNENKFDSIFKKYFSSIKGSNLITASNTIKSAGVIAINKPNLTEKITKELLKVEKANYESEECLNIAKGQAIDSFFKYFNQIKNKKQVIEFVKRQLKNSRPAVRKKAEKFLIKINR